MQGEEWVDCPCGRRHWGRYGAAGLLVQAPDASVLLQHRAVWSHDGGTWGVPGGALRAGESAQQAALRETVEETALDVAVLELLDCHVVDHGGWSYTTIVARAPGRLPVRAERESLALRWVAARDVTALPLHPGFAASWPELSALLG